jgi:hypothetical protein
MQLDRSRAGRIYGSSLAAWCQDGQYFNAAGEPISREDAAKPDPADVESGAILKAWLQTDVTPEVVEVPVVTAVVIPPPEHVAVVDLPVERKAGAKNWGDDRLLKLKPLKAGILAAMVMRAGGTPKTGLGGKKANIAWILANVKD